MARGDWIVNHDEFAIRQQESEGLHRVSPRVCGRDYGARDTAFSGCKISAAAAAVAGGRQFAKVRQRHCHALESEMDITLPLYWESMVSSCRSSLNALEFEFNRNHAAKESDSWTQDTAAASCISHAPHDLYYYKGQQQRQQLPLRDLCPRLKMVDRLSNEKREPGRKILQEGNSSLARKVEEAHLGADRGSAMYYNETSPASRHSRLFQPRYSKFCMKSPHNAPPVETTLDSRSSSFRSQSSSIAWETSGDKISEADDNSSSSPDSTPSVRDSMSSSNVEKQEPRRASTEELNNSSKTYKAGFLKDYSLKDYQSHKKQATEIRTSTLSTWLRPWKTLFGTKKSSIKQRSREPPEHTVETTTTTTTTTTATLATRFPDASCPIISSSAPMQQKIAPISACKNSELRGQKNRRSIPYLANEAPLTAAAATATGEKDRTQRLLRRESSLHSHIHNNFPSELPAKGSSSSSNFTEAQKELSLRMMHSKSSTMPTTSASPRVGVRRLRDQDEEEEGCAITPKLQSRESWKKYVKKILMSPHTDQQQQRQLQQIHNKIDNNNMRVTTTTASSSSSSSSRSVGATAAAAATTTPATAANTPLGTPSRKALPALKLHASSASASEESSTKTPAAAAAAVTKLATTTGSKISRIFLASGVLTPRSKSANPSCSNDIPASSRGVTINHHNNKNNNKSNNNNMAFSEQHSAVQGAIAHCKQSHSQQEQQQQQQQHCSLPSTPRPGLLRNPNLDLNLP